MTPDSAYTSFPLSDTLTRARTGWPINSKHPLNYQFTSESCILNRIKACQ